MKDMAILIPARYNSSRFPGKMLELFDGVPLVKRVYDTCASTGLDTYVLTDDERIAALAPNSIMTPRECENGTERCAAVIDRLNYNAFINVQGDMIDVTSEMIDVFRRATEDWSFSYYRGVATLYTDMKDSDQSDSSVVKLIHTGKAAHWFCRSSLKYGSRHIGVYYYTRDALKNYQTLTAYPEEKIESLEQLRWLQNGIGIDLFKVEFDGIEINTPEDANAWRERRWAEK